MCYPNIVVGRVITSLTCPITASFCSERLSHPIRSSLSPVLPDMKWTSVDIITTTTTIITTTTTTTTDSDDDHDDGGDVHGDRFESSSYHIFLPPTVLYGSRGGDSNLYHYRQDHRVCEREEDCW